MNKDKRRFRYDGKDSDGTHWGEYLTDAGEPTEDYFEMGEPTLSDAIMYIEQLLELLKVNMPIDDDGANVISEANEFLARADAEQMVSMITLKVTLTKEMESFWGVEDILTAYAGDTKEDVTNRLVELINEDITSFLEGAVWDVEIVKEV